MWSRLQKIRNVIVFIAGIFLGMAAGSFLLTVQHYYQPAEKATISKDARAVLEICENEMYRPSCYEIELPKYMDRGYSMEQVFALTREVQKVDPDYQYCHVLGHYLSQKETAKDPSKWKDVIARAPSGICSNGAIHGAFQERFRVDALPDASIDELKNELVGICEPRADWSPTRLEQATCTHALGHLTMYVTDGDINKSLSLCDELVEADDIKSNVQLCYDGAFMQIFQPLDPEDIALVEHFDIDTKERARSFCSSYSEERFGSCTSESWPRFNDEIYDPLLIENVCEPVLGTGWQYERCVNGIFYVAIAMLNLESDKVYDFCSQTPDNLKNRCFGNAVTRMIEVDWNNTMKAINLCDASQTVGAGEACYEELVKYSAYVFTLGSLEWNNLCENLPAPYNKQCFGRI